MFVEEVFQGTETMGVRDVGIEGSDINSSHDNKVISWSHSQVVT